MTEQASFARRYFFPGFLVGEVIERKKGGNVLCCTCKPHSLAEQTGDNAMADNVHVHLRRDLIPDRFGRAVLIQREMEA